jgi:hypothetical protein
MVYAAGLTRDDGERLAFAASSLVCGAIDSDEFRRWCDLVIEQNDVESVPLYIFDLSMSRGSLLPGIYNVFGFVPHWEHTEEQADALAGIGLIRWGPWEAEASISEEEALEALRRHPEIEDAFRKAFPFIQY